MDNAAPRAHYMLVLHLVAAWVKAHSIAVAGTADAIVNELAAMPAAEAALVVRARLEFHDDLTTREGGGAVAAAYRAVRARLPALMRAEVHLVPGGDADETDYDRLASGSPGMAPLLADLAVACPSVLAVLNVGLWSDFRDSDTHIRENYDHLAAMLRLPTGPRRVAMTVERIETSEDDSEESDYDLPGGAWEPATVDWEKAFESRKYASLLEGDKLTATCVRKFLRHMHRAREVFIGDEDLELGTAITAAVDFRGGPQAVHDPARGGWLVKHSTRRSA